MSGSSGSTSRLRFARPRFFSPSRSFRSASSRLSFPSCTTLEYLFFQRSKDSAESIFVSYEPDLRIATQGFQEGRTIGKGATDFVASPCDQIHFTSEYRPEFAGDLRDSTPVRRSQHKYIDVALGIGRPCGEGSEDERDLDALGSGELHP